MLKTLKRITASFLSVILICISSVVSLAQGDPRLTNRQDFAWGVCVHTPEINGSAYNPRHLDWQLKKAADMGVKLIRTGVSSNIHHTDRMIKMANSYGMRVMLVIPIPERTFGTDYNTESIKSFYKSQVSRYDGTKGFGKADYIQIDNELDNVLMERFGVMTDGTSISDYHSSDLANITAQIKAAVEGIKASGNDVKTVINFSWKHYGMLDYFYKNGVDWDIIGHDWYSDMMHLEETNGKTAYEIGDTVYQKFGKEIIICETNVRGGGFDFNEDDVSNWDILVRAMDEYYKRDFVIGACFYELSDEIGRQTEAFYDPEAHFGLLYTDTDGNLIEPKPIYHRIQSIIGGKAVEKSKFCIPEPKYENTLINEKKGYIGGTLVPSNTDSYCGNKGLVMFEAVDASEADFVELDIFVSHDTNRQPNLVFSNKGDNPNSKSGFAIPGLKEGWNHIVLDFRNATDGFTLNKLAVDTLFWGGIFSTEAEVSVTVANLAFTRTTQPTTYRGTLYSEFEGYDNVTVAAGENISSFPPIILPTSASLNVTGFIHFNVYVSRDCVVELHLNSTPKRAEQPNVIASAIKQISLTKGWNTVGMRTTDVLNLNGWNANQRFNNESITYIYLSGILSFEDDVIVDMESLVFAASGMNYAIQKGDYNADGVVDVRDLVFVKTQSLKTAGGWYPNVAEFDGADDSIINATDFTFLKKRIFADF